MARQRQPTKQYPRSARVNEVVIEVLAEEVDRLSDPRVGFMTLTGVVVSADLRHADVYYSVLGTPEQRADTADGLLAARAHLRSVLGRKVRLKYLPELRFHEDPGVINGERVESIIREMHTGDA